jgi:hypothetical protein
MKNSDVRKLPFLHLEQILGYGIRCAECLLNSHEMKAMLHIIVSQRNVAMFNGKTKNEIKSGQWLHDTTIEHC